MRIDLLSALGILVTSVITMFIGNAVDRDAGYVIVLPVFLIVWAFTVLLVVLFTRRFRA